MVMIDMIEAETFVVNVGVYDLSTPKYINQDRRESFGLQLKKNHVKHVHASFSTNDDGT